MAKEFVKNCLHILGQNPLLWISFQSNVLCDRARTSDEFEQHFKNTLSHLGHEYKFYVPKLRFNMRNSHEIGELAKTLKIEDYSGRKITNVVEPLDTPRSSLASSKPNLIAISVDDLHHHFDDLIETATEKGTINVILCGRSALFDPIKIKRSLLNLYAIKEEDIFCHTFKLNNTKEDMKRFLLNPNGILICHDELFTGMEAEAVVYCVDEWDKYKNLRVNAMRASSKLNIIYSFIKTDHDYIDFKNANLNPKFMPACDGEMSANAFECLLNTRDLVEDKIIVCKPCAIGCQSGHPIKSKRVRIDLKIEGSVKCECKSKSFNCIF